MRAIFIGHGGVGKTSLINVLHGGDVTRPDQMTKGTDIRESIHEAAGVFTRIVNDDDRQLTTHFWDFGGQVMAHATHQFFLRAGCLYVIVIDARKERNANEEAEYWLEHVRAFGGRAPVLLVGNKADQVPVSLDLRTLREKHDNIVGFYPLSCTEANGRLKLEFERFARDFYERLAGLSGDGQRFSEPEFKVLKEVQHARRQTTSCPRALSPRSARRLALPRKARSAAIGCSTCSTSSASSCVSPTCRSCPTTCSIRAG